MDTQNIENGRTGVHVLDGKIPRASRCRRAALSNVTNIGLPVAVLKKSKKSQSHCPKQQVVTSLDKESYTEDIVRYLLEKEKEHCICVNYMDKQPDLKPAMRSILVDWIIQACTKFKVTDETQYYVVQYVDRFLSSELIERSNLQLVGICAIFLASKFEEISVPTMSDLCYITEDTYTPKELLRMEGKMLKALDYNLGYPTSIQFLRYIVKVLSCSRHQYYCAKFICELMSVSYSALRWKPSVIAVSSLDILNKVSTFLPVLRQQRFQIDESSMDECKHFIRNTIVNDDLKDHPIVFHKFKSEHSKLKAALKSNQM